jgi:hypothetical protein
MLSFGSGAVHDVLAAARASQRPSFQRFIGQSLHRNCCAATLICACEAARVMLLVILPAARLQVISTWPDCIIACQFVYPIRCAARKSPFRSSALALRPGRMHERGTQS